MLRHPQESADVQEYVVKQLWLTDILIIIIIKVPSELDLKPKITLKVLQQDQESPCSQTLDVKKNI